MTMLRIVLFLSVSLAYLSLLPAAAASASCAEGTTSPFCGSSCCCSAEDDLKLREAFLGEVKAHGCKDDAACRSQLKAYICAVCPFMAKFHLSFCTWVKAHMFASKVAPLMPPAVATVVWVMAAATTTGAGSRKIVTRHDDDLGGGSRTPDSSTLCVQQASTQAYDGVVPLHDGSGRLLCWRRNGQIWLATVDVVDPTGVSILRVGNRPVVDLGSRISQDAAARGGGLAGVAVHSSGRLYVSYYTTTDGPDGGSAFLVIDQVTHGVSSSFLKQHGPV